MLAWFFGVLAVCVAQEGKTSWVPIEANEDEEDTGYEIEPPYKAHSLSEQETKVGGISGGAAAAVAGTVGIKFGNAIAYMLNKENEAGVIWNAAENSGKRNGDRAMAQNNIMNEIMEGDVLTYEQESTAAFDLDKPLPELENRRSLVLNKLGETDLKKNEKLWEQGRTLHGRDFAKKLKKIKKDENRFIKDAGKAQSVQRRTHEKFAANFNKKAAKQLKKVEKNFDKEKSHGTSDMESYAEDAAESNAGFTELSENIISHTEKMDVDVANLAEGTQAKAGLASSVQSAEQLEEQFDNYVDQEAEDVESGHAIKVADQLAELSSMIEEVYAAIEEKGGNIDAFIAELAENGEQALDKLSEAATTQNVETQTKLKEEKEKIKTIDRSVKATTEAISNSQSDSAALRDELEGGADKLYDSLKDGAEEALTNVVTNAYRNKDETDATVQGFLKRGEATVESDGSMASQKVQTAFAKVEAETGSEIEATQHKSDEATLKATMDANTVDKVYKLTKSDKEEVENYNKKDLKNTERTTEYLNQMKADGQANSERLQTQNLDISKLLQKQSGTAMSDISETSMKLNGAMTGSLKSMTTKIDALQQESNNKNEDQRAEMRKIESNANDVTMILDRVDQGIKGVKDTSAEAVSAAQDELAKIDGKMMDRQDELNGQMKTEFANDVAIIGAIQGQALKAVQSGIGRYGVEAGKEMGEATQVLTSANFKESEASKTIGARKSVLSSTFGNEETVLKEGQKFKLTAAERIQKQNDAQGALDNSAGHWKSMDDELKQKVQGRMDEEITSLDAAHEGKLNDIRSEVEKMNAENAKVLNDERAIGSNSFNNGQESIKNALGQSESMLGQSETRFKDFTKMFKNDNRNDLEVGAGTRSLDQLEADATARAKAESEMDRSFATVQSEIKKTINGQALSGADGIRTAESHMQSSSKDATTAEQAQLTGLREAYSDAGIAISKTARESESREAKLRGDIDAQSQNTRTDLTQMEAKVRSQMYGVEAEERKNLGQIASQGMAENRLRAGQAAESSQVGRDIQSEARNVDFMAHDMMSTIGSILPNIDPTAQINLSFQQMEDIKKLMHLAQQTANGKEGDIAKQIQGAQDRIAAILSEGNMEAQMLNTNIRKTAGNVQTALQQVGSHLTEMKQSIQGTVNDASAIVEDLDTAIDNKVAELNQRYDRTAKDVEKAEDVGNYQGSDALDKVIEVVEGAQKEDTRLTVHKDTVLVPSVTQWRENVQAVFESMGMALDLDRVERMAQEGMAADDEGILNAKERLGLEARRSAQALSAKIAALRAKAAAMIAAIMANENLSEAEKRAMIAKLQQECDAAAYALVKESRNLLSKQNAVIRNIDEDLNKMNNLIERAALLAQGHDGSAEANRMVMDLHAEIKANFAKLRSWAANGEIGAADSHGSLLQVDEGDLTAELERTALKAFAVRMKAVERVQKEGDKELDQELEHSKNTQNESEVERLIDLETNFRKSDAELDKEDTKWDRALDALPAFWH